MLFRSDISETVAIVGAYEDDQEYGSVSTYAKVQDAITIVADAGVEISGNVDAFSFKGKRQIKGKNSIEWKNWNNVGEEITLQCLAHPNWIISGAVDNTA